jgi:hypothetical protein
MRPGELGAASEQRVINHGSTGDLNYTHNGSATEEKQAFIPRLCR